MKSMMQRALRRIETAASSSLPFDAHAVPVPMDTGIVNRKVQNKAVFVSALANIHLPQFDNNIFYYNLGVSPYFSNKKELDECLSALSESYPGVPRTTRQRGLVVTPMILRNTSITASFRSDENPALNEIKTALTANGFIVGKL